MAGETKRQTWHADGTDYPGEAPTTPAEGFEPPQLDRAAAERAQATATWMDREQELSGDGTAELSESADEDRSDWMQREQELDDAMSGRTETVSPTSEAIVRPAD